MGTKENQSVASGGRFALKAGNGERQTDFKVPFSECYIF